MDTKSFEKQSIELEWNIKGEKGIVSSNQRITLNKFERSLVDEISTISGYPEKQVRNILELTFIRQLESYLSNQPIRIPFIGDLETEFISDSYEAGTRVANIKCSIEPSELYKQLIGEFVDGESDILKNFLDSQTESEIDYLLEK